MDQIQVSFYTENKEKSKNQQKKEKKLTKDGLTKEEKLKKKLLMKQLLIEQSKEKNKKKVENIKNAATYEDHTSPGEKKDISFFPENYDPSYVEKAWGEWWKTKKFFNVKKEEAMKVGRDKRFVMILPPPNVTGSLHLGHSLMGAIEDSITRYKRLTGSVALWVPGTDHAGIATQSVVEKQLIKTQGKYRTDFTRSEFLEKVWQWKEEYGGKIMEQFRRLGVSFDTDREYFTMDEERSKSVKYAFINLFERGILYRAKKMVNWCCFLQTAISDVELEDIELNGATKLEIPGHKGKYEFGVLIDFAYKLKDQKDKEIIVSTTRIETMLGDTAVAVHPDDERYKDLVGKELIHPFFKDRKIKIIADSILVDKDFGTGAVKITPAHDPNDFECGKRHNLELINLFNDDGTLNENGGEFKGMKRYDCRNAILKRLEEMKLLRGKHDNKMVIKKCSKSGDIIEPMVKSQWWVNCQEVAKRTIKEVNEGIIKIIPEFQKQTLFNFLENIRDWCVSRQLWWGHRCPVYLVSIKGKLENPDDSVNDNWVAAENEEEAIKKAAQKFKVKKDKVNVKQDTDVLDTWFSSGLLPFSVFGWPDTKSEELKTFFPTDLLETGHDIIFFWVARMIFMSYFFMDMAPFHTVYLHPIVKDSQGRKMSKSLGNIVDPLAVIDGSSLEELISQLEKGNLSKSELEKGIKEKKKEFPSGIPKCGADALRLGLMSYLIQGRNINLDVNRVVGYRFFGNKLWNAFKFLTNYINKDFKIEPIDKKNITFFDKWILNKLGRAIKLYRQHFDAYDFGLATKELYSYWYDNFCDVYVEAAKGIFRQNSSSVSASKNVLLYAFESGLILLHPLMPFVSEELYQRLPVRNSKAESICISSFPNGDGLDDDEIDEIGKKIMDAVHAVLSILSQFHILNSRPNMAILCKDEKVNKVLEQEKNVFSTLARVGELFIINNKDDKKVKGWLGSVVNSEMEVFLDIKEKIDLKKEIERLNKGLNEKEKYISNLEKKRSTGDYMNRVPESVKKEDTEKLENAKIEKNKILESIKILKEMN